MSREFKFRAKRVTDGVWVYGGLVMADDFCIIDQRNELYVEEEYKFRGDTHLFRLSGAMCDEDTVGQFTGLHDKNGAEIYEGDIVKAPLLDPIFGDIIKDAFCNAEITFNKGSFVVSYYKRYRNIYLSDLYDKIEVIGNIHDNPELLEE